MKNEAAKTGTTKRHGRPFIETEFHGKGVSVWVSVIYTEDASPNEVIDVIDAAGALAGENYYDKRKEAAA